MYVYKRTEFSPHELYTVGFYDPNGKWVAESDHNKEDDAAKRVILLNGGVPIGLIKENEMLREALRSIINTYKEYEKSGVYELWAFGELERDLESAKQVLKSAGL